MDRRTYISNVSAEAPRGARGIRRTWVKVLAVTLLVTIPAFLVGSAIWHPVRIEPSPGQQLPFFMVVSFFETVTLGMGVSFLIFDLPLVRRVSAESKLRAWLMYLGIG